MTPQEEAAYRLAAAIVYLAGGEVRMPDSVMRKDFQISAEQSPTELSTIYRARLQPEIVQGEVLRG